MTETQEAPICPRCKERPRAVWTSGLVGSYCLPCSVDTDRERKGWSPADRICELCGRSYRGNRRATAQVCPDCRGTCVTCRKPKNAADKHTQCPSCRKEGRICRECNVNPTYGNRPVCWTCANKDGEASAKDRDRLYGLAPGQFDQMLTAQGGVCAISGHPETSVNKKTGKVYPLALDHDRACCPGNRSCGKCVRGLITRNLNIALGMFGDDVELMEAAIAYVKLHRKAV
jgi:hypothetical protein